MNFKINKILIASLILVATSLAERPWRSYQIYQPQISRHYVANPVFLESKYNDYSSVIWFKGNWYCFWTGKTTLDGSPTIYMSESQDAKVWSMPAACFVDSQLCNEPVKTAQTRPVVLEYRDVLYVFWSGKDFETDKINATYFSTLTAIEEKWDTQKMLWGDLPLPIIDNVEYSVEFTSNPIITADKKIIIPVILTSTDNSSVKIASAALSDTNGSSWQISQSGVELAADIDIANVAIWKEHSTESDYSMIISAGIKPKLKKYQQIPENAASLYWSTSTDFGHSWSEPDKLPTPAISSGLSVVMPYSYDKAPRSDDRFIMLFNDSHYQNNVIMRDHSRLAMFFNRGGGLDFVAGNNITGSERFTTNPNIAIRNNRLIVSYTQGVQEAAIKIAHISAIPERQRSYIYPRTPQFRDSSRPILTEAGYYNFEGNQYITTEEAVRINENGFSGAVLFRGDFEGIIFDSRDKKHEKGFALLIEEGNIKLLLPGLEAFVAEKIEQEFIYWSYVGFTLDALHGNLNFYLNGNNIQNIQYKKGMLETLSSEKGYVGKSPSNEGFVGDIKYLAFYNQTLDDSEHRHIHNSFAGVFNMAYSRGNTKSPPLPVLEVDAEKANEKGEIAGFIFPEYNKDGFVEQETITGRNILRFNGQAIAGLDIDTNDRRYGDYLQTEFAFMVEGLEQMTICTIGDADSPVRIVARENCLYLSLSGNEQLIGEVQPNRWQTIVIFSGGTITRAKLGNNRFRQIAHTPQATWMYLGQAYNRVPQDSAESSFLIDVSTVRTRIVRQ